MDFRKKMFKKFENTGDNIITGGHFPLPPMFPRLPDGHGSVLYRAFFFAEVQTFCAMNRSAFEVELTK